MSLKTMTIRSVPLALEEVLYDSGSSTLDLGELKQAEDAKREAEELKKNEEKNILEKSREIIGRLMLSVDIDPDKGDRGYRALCYIKENGLADDFEKYENSKTKASKDEARTR